MDSSPTRQAPQPLGEFTKRVLVVLLLGSLAVALWRILDIVVLLFGAVLIAVGLRGVAKWLQRTMGFGQFPWLALVVLLLIASLGLALWFFGTVVAAQIDEIVQQAPEGLRVLLDRLQAHPYGRYALAQMRDIGAAGATGWAGSILATVMRSATRGF